MSRPIHCPKCQAERGVAVPKVCPHLSAAELIATVMEAKTATDRLISASALFQYLETLQKAFINLTVSGNQPPAKHNKIDPCSCLGHAVIREAQQGFYVECTLCSNRGVSFLSKKKPLKIGMEEHSSPEHHRSGR